MHIASTISRATLLAAVFGAASMAVAQEGSLMLRGADPAQGPGLTLQTGSFMYRQLPPGSKPKELEVHDIVTVVVNYRSIMQSEGNTQARKTNTINTTLTDWILFRNGKLKSDPLGEGDPKVGANNNQQSRAQSNLQLRDTLTFRMAVKIVEILPNGSLRVEGDSNVQVNDERWQVYLAGTVRRESIQPDNTVTDDAMVDRDIRIKSDGMVYDGYARGWLAKLIDKYKLF